MDHEYDCVVVGAGGAGLRAAMGLSEYVGCFWNCKAYEIGIQDCCDYQVVPYSFSHCGCSGWCECCSW